MTIKFIDFWDNFNPLNDNFFKLLFKWYNLKLVKHNNPDVLVYSGVYGKKQNYKKYKNSIKIWYTAENRNYDEEYFNDCDYSISHHIRNNNTHLRLLNGIRKFGLDKLIQFNNRIIPNNIINQKKKFCIFIYSNSVKKRNDFFNILNQYKHVDSCGSILNNMDNNWILPKDNNTIIGIDRVIKYISKYKFIISFENENINGYTTEKLLWGYLANTIPIYYGNMNINNDFNDNSLINANIGFEHALNEIKLLDNNNNLYIGKLKQSIFNNNIIPNIWTKKYIKKWCDKIFNQ